MEALDGTVPKVTEVTEMDIGSVGGVHAVYFILITREGEVIKPTREGRLEPWNPLALTE